jgi:hypothetical protein
MENKIFLFYLFIHFTLCVCDRDKKVQKPEIYLWEKIFQIDHDTMPHLGTRRRRWWQMQYLDFKGQKVHCILFGHAYQF